MWVDPSISSLGWKNALRIAKAIVKNIHDGRDAVENALYNPLGECCYFRTTTYFYAHYIKKTKKFNGVIVKDLITFSGNTFFNYA